MFSFDSSDLLDLSDAIEDIVTDGIKETIVETQAALVSNSPVLSGTLRANWQTSKNTPPIGVLSIGSENANAFRASVGINYTLGPVYYISNNVKYVDYVNSGTARQQGQFFVEAAITQTLRRLNR